MNQTFKEEQSLKQPIRSSTGQNQYQQQKKNLHHIIYQKSRLQLFSYVTIDHLNQFSIFPSDDQIRQEIKNQILKFQVSKQSNQIQTQKNYQVQSSPFFDLMSQKQSRLMGVMMGLGIGDALGSSTEFLNFKKDGYQLFIDQQKGFKAISKSYKQGKINPRFKQFKPINAWTDDTSMALCLAYSLIINKYEFKPNNLRCLFHLWWNKGLGNGGLSQSVGLGGNIAMSFKQFQQNPSLQYVSQENKNNNGNGSLMRLAPVPIVFHDNKQKAMQIAFNQSRTTHNGQEAKQCCRLLTLIIINLVNRKQGEDWKNIIQQSGYQFNTPVESVKYLAESKPETKEMFDKKKGDNFFRQFNESEKDRNWNWKSKDFTYSITRLNRDHGYIGSYCMDALAMALHIVWYSHSFRQCVQNAADMGGDSDTVGAIAGQIAGAIYGFNKETVQLYQEIKDFKQNRYQLLLVSIMMIPRQKTNPGQDTINSSIDKNNRRFQQEQDPQQVGCYSRLSKWFKDFLQNIRKYFQQQNV